MQALQGFYQGSGTLVVCLVLLWHWECGFIDIQLLVLGSKASGSGLCWG